MINIRKKDNKERIRTTNCYICQKSLPIDKAKKNPDNNSDKRLFCRKHYKILFGKKKKLRKRI